MKFKNLKLGNKLAVGYGFFILILLAAGIFEFVSLKGIERKNRTSIKSYDLAGILLESKYHALQDMQVLTEIMESNINDQLTDLLNLHATARSEFRNAMAKAKETAVNTDWGSSFKEEKEEIQQSLVKVEKQYEGEYLLKYEEFKKIRTEILTTNNNQRLGELSSESNRLNGEIHQSFNSLMRILEELEVTNQQDCSKFPAGIKKPD